MIKIRIIVRFIIKIWMRVIRDEMRERLIWIRIEEFVREIWLR